MPLKTFDEFIWKHVFNNFTAKVMALAMALGLWLYAYVFSYTNSDVEIPVHIHVGEGWSVEHILPDEAVHGENLLVKVKLSYPRRFEDQFTQELRAGKTYLDCNVAPMPDQKPVTVTLKKELLVTSRDFSLQIESFKPPELKIELVREAAMMVPVVPKYSAPPPGYRVEYAFPLTAEVMIRGPEVIIKHLHEAGIETEEMNISAPRPGSREEWDLQPMARIPSSAAFEGKKYPIVCTDLVQCNIHLARAPVEKSFTEVPIQLLVPPGYAYVATLLRESTTNVQVTGPKSAVEALKKENIVLYVDVRDPKLVPQETPYTQPIYAQIVDEHQRDMVVKPATSTCAVKISEAKPK
ncbi:MAG: CdaR family protein [Candidatus Brocadiia bacterium]|jgi:hypothetical protein